MLYFDQIDFILYLMITHRQLISLASLFEHDIFSKGLCRGFSAMWVKAVCCNDVITFNHRLKILEQFIHQPEILIPLINEIRLRAKQKGYESLSSEEKILFQLPAFF